MLCKKNKKKINSKAPPEIAGKRTSTAEFLSYQMHLCSLQSVERKQQKKKKKKKRNMEEKVSYNHTYFTCGVFDECQDENGIKRSSFFKPPPNSKPIPRVCSFIPVHPISIQFSSIQSCFASQPRPGPPACKRWNARYAQKCPNYNQRGRKG